MSWCGGKVCCEIYREKRFCRRGDHADEGEPCDCRHAKWACEVGECSLMRKCANPVSKLALAREAMEVKE